MRSNRSVRDAIVRDLSRCLRVHKETGKSLNPEVDKAK